MVPVRGRGMLTVERARKYLAECKDTDEVGEVRDQAKAVEMYLRSRKASIDAQQDAAEIRLRAERRLGELTKEIPRSKGAAKKGVGRRGKKNGVALDDGVVPLSERGIDRRDAANWQALAAIPEKRFDRYVTEARQKGERISAKTPIALERQDKKHKLAKRLQKKPLPLPSGKFDVIIADPPWPYEKREGDTTSRGHLTYPPMEVAKICRLPVPKHAEKDCVLFLWTTNAHLLSGDALRVVRAWGFEPKTMVTWEKNKMGTGDWLRGKTEHCILAVRGRPLVTLTNQTTSIHGNVREHSRKPESFYDLVNGLCPGTKLELFGRQKRKGYRLWGAETGKFAR